MLFASNNLSTFVEIQFLSSDRNNWLKNTQDYLLKRITYALPTHHLQAAFHPIPNPCGGRVEYLHCDPASRKRQRNGTKIGRAIA
jgi:hypothetical protein